MSGSAPATVRRLKARRSERSEKSASDAMLLSDEHENTLMHGSEVMRELRPLQQTAQFRGIHSARGRTDASAPGEGGPAAESAARRTLGRPDRRGRTPAAPRDRPRMRNARMRTESPRQEGRTLRRVRQAEAQGTRPRQLTPCGLPGIRIGSIGGATDTGRQPWAVTFVTIGYL
jgi:hypothetical protein